MKPLNALMIMAPAVMLVGRGVLGQASVSGLRSVVGLTCLAREVQQTRTNARSIAPLSGSAQAQSTPAETALVMTMHFVSRSPNISA